MVTFERFDFTDHDFQYICGLIADHAGIHLTPSKRELVYGRLAKRLRQLGISSFRQYCEMLNEKNNVELVQCINAITTNVTSFFREDHHFDYLETTVFPELYKKYKHQIKPRFRIWSAGCSSGEEPYSIAMVLKKQIYFSEKWDIKILATDLDSNILDKARTGIYTLDQLEKVKSKKHKHWFRKGLDHNERVLHIAPEIKDLVYFRQLNLTAGQWPMQGQFDAIFCRNVVIYFEKETRQALLNRFADMLTDGGYLFIGHSESLFGFTDRFKSVGKTMYKKIA
jgi:chemotaxis protein methyltransferase CheR